MSKTQQFIWELYCLIVLAFTIRKALNFFLPGTEVYLYFQILHGFDSLFLFNYILNFFQITTNLIHFLPLALYIYRRRLFSPAIWKTLFIFKVIFDICGHSFETNYLVSLFHHDPLVCLYVLLSSIFVYVPAYWACYIYAFKPETLDLKDI